MTTPIRYGSVCSGIEAVSVAWRGMDFAPQWFSEIAPFPSAVLRARFPHVPNLGDFTQIGTSNEAPPVAIDLLVGGTPCQSFSVAGLRGGLGDARGNLALEFLRLAQRTRPRWVVWENVPGVLSSLSHDAPDPCPPPIPLDVERDGEEVVVDEYDADESHALGCFLAGLAELGYGWAYRVLDAQFFGVPQRRRRIFVVGYLGDSRRAAAVLFERNCLSRNPPPSRETRTRVAAAAGSGVAGDGGVARSLRAQAQSSHRADSDNFVAATSSGRGWWDDSDVGASLRAQTSPNKADTLIAHALTTSAGGQRLEPTSDNLIPVASRGFFDDAPSHALSHQHGVTEDGTGRGVPVVATAYRTSPNCGAWETGERTDALTTGSDPTSHVIAIQERAVSENPTNGPQGAGHREDVAFTLEARNKVQSVAFMPSRTLTSDGGIDSRFSERPVCDALHSGSGSGSNKSPVVKNQSGVRRLLPVECERLMGLPDRWTDVEYRGKPASDGPRYKAVGNSMAVPVLAWIGRRIQMVDKL